MTIQIGYCTNVHAGADLAQTRQNLEQHALNVKAQHSPDQPMGVGLWLAAPAASQLLEQGKTSEFADWLASVGLVPFTFNGFPYGDFHQPVVKHRVYEPTWSEVERLDYTLNLIKIQDKLLSPGMEGSISTLPIAWGDPAMSGEATQHAVDHLRSIATHLAQLEAETGRCIYVCLEPEPGCVLTYSDDVVSWFENQLMPGADNEGAIRRHIRVCHDVCHAAVMFEPQADVLQRFATLGIRVGKVQVSSAIRLPFAEIAPTDRAKAVEQLTQFAEDRYLHQTTIRRGDEPATFFEDLPKALAHIGDPRSCSDEVRVHFHVPIYLESFGHLQTSRSEIRDCLQAAMTINEVEHYEVETYAWGVLPEELQHATLADGIAQEMSWFSDLLNPSE